MTYEEFARAYEAAMANARSLYAAEARGVSLTSNGMDKSCEDFIFSPGYVEGDAEAVAAEAVRQVDEDFADKR